MCECDYHAGNIHTIMRRCVVAGVGEISMQVIFTPLCAGVPWQVWVFTSDIKNAGTDADVYMVVYGEKGKSDDIKLENKSDSFEQGHMDMFKIDTVDVGVPYKIRVWHDNSGIAAGWHLDKVLRL